MAKNLLEIIIKMTKQGTGDKDARTGLDKLSGSFKSLTGFSLGSATALGVAGIALKKMADFAQESVKETVAYNKQIREMTQVTGLLPEEISRIVQVGDDWGVSIEAIRTSLAFMNKQGITPSIDNLAKMADEYVTSADKAAWANDAVKTLGRGYETLIPLLALGGDGFREAAAGIDDSLIATDKAIDASREYEAAMDDLNDSVEGVKRRIGNELIPVLANFAGALNDGFDEQGNYNDALEIYNGLLKRGLIAEKDKKEIMDKVISRTATQAEVTEDMVRATDKALAAFKKEYPEEVRLVQITKDLSEVTDDATDSMEDLTKGTEDETEAVVDYSSALDELNFLMSGNLGPEMEDFIDTQGDITQEMADTLAEIELLKSQGYSELSDKVIGLRDKYGELQTKLGEAESEHDKAVKEMRFDILQYQAELDGVITAEEANFLDFIANTWGLIDPATEEYKEKSAEALLWIEQGGSAAEAEAILQGQETRWSLLKGQAIEAGQAVLTYGSNLDQIDGKTVDTYINTYHYDYYEETGKPGPGGHYAGGADFIVPPGYHDNFPMYVDSGEHVTVQPAGTTNNFSISLASQGSAPQDIKSTVRLMELLYG